MELEERIESSGLAREEVLELVELGALEGGGGARLTFVSRTVIQARRAARLRDTFGLNTPGMALALTDLARIERLEQRLRELEAGRP
ncbi:MAG: chaperone modulator CbpM [Cyanobacteriota bacterium]|nr:chaperone modulator CbpM [Cyanobacteriota bacterium]